VHVVDLATNDPERDYGTIREELRLHDPRLLEKTMLVVANKLDLPEASEHLAAFRAARDAEGLETIAVSAQSGDGIGQLLGAFARLLPSAEEMGAPAEPAGVVVHRFDATREGLSVERDADGFRVRGRLAERLAAQTDFDNEESAERFQRDLSRLGIDRELRRAGVSAGDMVRIGKHELEWDGEAWG
jgi:GTP-binding protein